MRYRVYRVYRILMRRENGANDEFEERFKITFDKLLKLNVILKLDPRYSNFILSIKTISNRRIGRKL